MITKHFLTFRVRRIYCSVLKEKRLERQKLRELKRIEELELEREKWREEKEKVEEEKRSELLLACIARMGDFSVLMILKNNITNMIHITFIQENNPYKVILLK